MMGRRAVHRDCCGVSGSCTKIRNIVLISIAVSVLIYVYDQARTPVKYVFKNAQIKEPCSIPTVDPFDASVRKFYSKLDPLQCDSAPQLLYLDDDNIIQLNVTAMEYYKLKSVSDIECIIRPIRRRSDDNDIEYNGNIKFSPPRKVTCDFNRVICKNLNGYIVYDNILLAVTNTSDSFTGDDSVNSAGTSNYQFNVLMFGIDSLSRSASFRYMPKMRKSLSDIGSHDFKGFMKVGDNTLPNVAPLLFGLMKREGEFHNYQNDYIDKWPFVWNNYSSKGYSTLYMEDEITIMAFNLYSKGFHQQPTSHYMRTYWLARRSMAQEKSGSNQRYLGGKESESRFCNQNNPNHVTTLDYMKRFMQHYSHKSKFMYSFFTELPHDVIHKVQWADEDFANFFKWLDSNGHLDNTLLIVFSDHGNRASAIRNTYVGRVESRMPLLSIKLPKQFENMHKRATESVLVNTNRLVTMFDIHQTLIDVLNSNFDNPSVQYADGAPRGISLFRPVPENRTCADAWISESFCACYQQYVINVTGNEKIHKISTEVVKHINYKILSDAKCKKLSLYRVVSAVMAKLGLEHKGADTTGHTFSMYQFFRPETNRERYTVTIETVPGHALFDVTCEYSDNSGVRVLGNIDRTNMYGNQSACIDPSFLILKQFCYC